ncbi:MAG: helix-hairpin-helix domain-containing protein [Alphaproteobacteria bacterium]|nr:helix-hairpin-helix domain-containing protein [Alphaproteobacteria bacterium]
MSDFSLSLRENQVLKRFAWVLLVGFAVALPAGAQTRPGTPAAAAQIDLNSASRDDLMTLDGIGEVRADAIIRARPFRVKGELVERRLIPESLYDKLSDKVTVRPIPGTAPVPTTRPATVPQRKS